MSLYQLGNDTDTPRTPVLGHQVWIAPGAHVIGDVHLGDRVSIWFNAVLRGDNDRIDIGADSNIQDGSILHVDAGVPLSVGQYVTIGHRVILHGCTIGSSTLIGMGSTLLNHCQIGAHSIVGANTLIPEGKIFPEGVLIVGSPGKIIRELTEGEIQRLSQGARHYAHNAQLYHSKLQEIGVSQHTR